MVTTWVCNTWMSKTQPSASKEEAAACKLQLAHELVVSFTTTWTKPNSAFQILLWTGVMRYKQRWRGCLCLVHWHTNSWDSRDPALGSSRLWSGMERKCLKWRLCRELNTRRWLGSFGNPTTSLLISSCVSQGETKPNPFSHTDERQNNFTYCHW